VSPETIQYYRDRVECAESYARIFVDVDDLAEFVEVIESKSSAPPPDSVRVRIAVAVSRDNTVWVKPVKEQEIIQWWDTDIARAIVVADIPRLVVPEVSGRIEVRDDG
jgi:hypothetical protein